MIVKTSEDLVLQKRSRDNSVRPKQCYLIYLKADQITDNPFVTTWEKTEAVNPNRLLSTKNLGTRWTIHLKDFTITLKDGDVADKLFEILLTEDFEGKEMKDLIPEVFL
jgi:hypothetical protein